MIKMTDTSAEPRSDFRESLWNTTAPFKMGVGNPPHTPTCLIEDILPAEVLPSHSILKFSSDPGHPRFLSCGEGEAKSYLQNSLVFFWSKNHWPVCFGFVHQYSMKEMKDFQVVVPPSLHPWVLLLNNSPPQNQACHSR